MNRARSAFGAPARGGTDGAAAAADPRPPSDGGLAASLRQAGPIPLDVELACEPGELLAIVGPSGSGKSTVLRSIAGLYTPAEGSVVCGGERWLERPGGANRPARARRVGMVPQNYGLFPHLDALANVLEGVPRDATARRARAVGLLERLHLAGLEHRLPRQLSGGQQQRVALARALARQPAVLLLDEPFSAVDRGTRETLYGELAELRDSLDMPTLLVTHDLDEAALLADRIAIVAHGRVLQTGAPLDVLHRPTSAQVARLVGLKNVFAGRVAGHDRARGATWIDWNGLTVRAPLAERFEVGAAVAWLIPAHAVLLLPKDRTPDADDTLVVARVAKVTPFGELLRITLSPFDRGGPQLWMTMQRHIVARHGVQEGEVIPLRLRCDGIRVVAPED